MSSATSEFRSERKKNERARLKFALTEPQGYGEETVIRVRVDFGHC